MKPVRRRHNGLILSAFAFVLVLVSGCNVGSDGPVPREEPFVVRPFHPAADGPGTVSAICYGPHRDGQRPGGPSPSAEELREDLRLMLPHWKLTRIYSSSGFAETLLSVIREDGEEFKVILGVWIDVEEQRDSSGVVLEQHAQAAAANRREVDAAIRLANEYPDIIAAVCVGNETQIFWSAHRSPLDILIGHVRRVRAGVAVPVTVADDFNYWNKPESRTLAAEVDFVMMHAHPMWNGLQLEGALEWLQNQLAAVQGVHPDRYVVLGETGWATSVHSEGEQSRLIKGRPGEAEQQQFYDAVRNWAETERLTVFFFEAFDENWKGGPHPAEVEKHWGLFRSDRSAKAAISGTIGE
jgi:exo-beta-1,3-glucanase (GH17 family)